MLPFHFVVIVVVEGNIFLNFVKTSINYIFTLLRLILLTSSR